MHDITYSKFRSIQTRIMSNVKIFTIYNSRRYYHNDILFYRCDTILL